MRLTARQLFPILLFIAILLMTIRPIADPDFWWHLRTGEWMVASHAVPHADPFSFTNLGKTWTAHEWLSELVIYGLYRLGGLPLLILTFALVITAAFWLVYRRSPGRPYFAGFALLLGVLAAAPAWGVRPQMLSLLLTSLFLFLLDRYSETRSLKWIIPLPFLTALWVNLHAGFALGLGIAAVYLGSDFLEWIGSLVSPSGKKRNLRDLLPLAAVLAACGLAVLANPNGARMYVYPFETLFSSAMQAYIQEWFSPDFHRPEWQPLAWMFLALIGLAIFARRHRIPLAHILLTLFFGYMSLRSMRHVPLFVLAAVPVLAALAEGAAGAAREALKTATGSPVQKAPPLPGWVNVLLILFALLAAGGRFASVVSSQPEVERETFPAAAVDWILANQPDGNIYNTYSWGGYLTWRLRDYPVFIDGRADLYGDAFIESFLDIYRARPGWQEALADNGVNLALVEPGSAIGDALAVSPEWELVFSDENSLLFVRR
ncbi:MAG: hypothetical protein FD146_585 [Anaerolineaceae bacterium]|nr:MAG: hypothetical protein FD146_585 [Anaerolineaceae bacterium]